MDYYGDQFKWFVGVVQGRSPDFESHVKVRIFGIHHIYDQENVSNDDLPDALVTMPTIGGHVTSGYSSHDLSAGAWVYGFFADGNMCEKPVIIGVFPGGISSNDSYPSPDSGDSFGTPSSPDGTTVPTDASIPTSIPGGNNGEKIYNYFYDKLKNSGDFTGDLHIVTSTMVGNFITESSLNPNAVNRGEGAVGIAQWRLDRRRALERFSGVGRGVIPPLEKQIAFVWHELHNQSEGRAARPALFSARTIEEASKAMTIYEGNAARRYSRARGYWVDTSRQEYRKIVTNSYAASGRLKYTGRPVPTMNNSGYAPGARPEE